MKPSEKVYFSLSLSMVDATAGMNVIEFAPISQEAADGLGHEDLDFTEVHNYSNLDLSRMEISGKVGVDLTKRVGLIFGFLYDDYTDDDPYLMDTTGNVYWVWTGLRLSF